MCALLHAAFLPSIHMRVWVKFRSRLGGIRKHQGLKKCACGPCRAHPYRRRTAARRLPPLPWPCMLWRGARKKRRCFRSEHCQVSVFRWDRQPVPRVLALRVYYIMLRSRCKASIMYNKGPVDKHKNSAETHRGPSRIINWEIAKDGRKMTFFHPLKI